MLDFAKHDELALLLVEREQPRLQEALGLARFHQTVGHVRALLPGHVRAALFALLVVGLGELAPATGEVLEPIAAVIGRHAIHPGAQRRVTAKALDGLEDADEHLLREVLGLGAVTKHAQEQAKHALLITQHERVERGFVAPSQAFDELSFLGVDHASDQRAAITNTDRAGRRPRASRKYRGHTLTDSPLERKFQASAGAGRTEFT